jgi:acyl-coenzyme A thioesterase PaaI-like protein/predicted N-acetyltransferase YhbS
VSLGFDNWVASRLARARPELVVVMTHQDRIVGTAIGVDCSLQAEGWVDQIAVEKAHRARGLGRALLEESFRRFWEVGRRRVALSTDSRTGALTLYEHVGMSVRKTYTRWAKALGPAEQAKATPPSPTAAAPAAADPGVADSRTHRVLAAQNVSRMCLVCGTENVAGLKACFYELENGDLAGIFRPSPEHQGYPGRLHGGVSSAILDETIGRAINMLHPDVWGVTVELTLRYRRPVPLDGNVRAVGRITQDSSRLFRGTGEIVLADGSVAVEASGTYLRLPIERIAGQGFDENQWFADERSRPDEIEI